MRFGLERMRRLLTALGSPQERFRAVHVVGTNGKSSTVRMTAAMLEAHGVRAGAFLSPHLTTFAERIRIGDADLGPDAFGAAVQRAAAAAAQGRPHAGAAATASRSSSSSPPPRSPSSPAAASRSRWSRRGSAAATTPPTCCARPSSCSPTSASSTRAGSGPTLADIAREKLAVVPRGATLVLGELEPEVEARSAARRPARGSCARRDAPAPVAAARLPAHELRRRLRGRAGAARRGSTRRGRGRGRARAQVPGRLQVVAERR